MNREGTDGAPRGRYTPEFGMKSGWWIKTVQKAGRCFRRVKEGEEAFMRIWHDAERELYVKLLQRDTRRPRPHH